MGDFLRPRRTETGPYRFAVGDRILAPIETGLHRAVVVKVDYKGSDKSLRENYFEQIVAPYQMYVFGVSRLIFAQHDDWVKADLDEPHVPESFDEQLLLACLIGDCLGVEGLCEKVEKPDALRYIELEQPLRVNLTMTPLRAACMTNQPDVVRLLLALPHEDITLQRALNSIPRRGGTPLFAACDQDNVECARLVIEARADLERANRLPDGMIETPLNNASYENSPRVVDLLIRSGADVHDKPHQDPRLSHRPLFMAARHGCYEIVVQLLEAGADVDGGWKLCLTLPGEFPGVDARRPDADVKQ